MLMSLSQGHADADARERQMAAVEAAIARESSWHDRFFFGTAVTTKSKGGKSAETAAAPPAPPLTTQHVSVASIRRGGAFHSTSDMWRQVATAATSLKISSSSSTSSPQPSQGAAESPLPLPEGHTCAATKESDNATNVGAANEEDNSEHLVDSVIAACEGLLVSYARLAAGNSTCTAIGECSDRGDPFEGFAVAVGQLSSAALWLIDLVHRHLLLAAAPAASAEDSSSNAPQRRLGRSISSITNASHFLHRRLLADVSLAVGLILEAASTRDRTREVALLSGDGRGSVGANGGLKSAAANSCEAQLRGFTASLEMLLYVLTLEQTLCGAGLAAKWCVVECSSDAFKHPSSAPSDMTDTSVDNEGVDNASAISSPLSLPRRGLLLSLHLIKTLRTATALNAFSSAATNGSPAPSPLRSIVAAATTVKKATFALINGLGEHEIAAQPHLPSPPVTMPLTPMVGGLLRNYLSCAHALLAAAGNDLHSAASEREVLIRSSVAETGVDYSCAPLTHTSATAATVTSGVFATPAPAHRNAALPATGPRTPLPPPSLSATPAAAGTISFSQQQQQTPNVQYPLPQRHRTTEEAYFEKPPIVYMSTTIGTATDTNFTLSSSERNVTSTSSSATTKYPFSTVASTGAQAVMGCVLLRSVADVLSVFVTNLVRISPRRQRPCLESTMLWLNAAQMREKQQEEDEASKTASKGADVDEAGGANKNNPPDAGKKNDAFASLATIGKRFAGCCAAFERVLFIVGMDEEGARGLSSALLDRPEKGAVTFACSSSSGATTDAFLRERTLAALCEETMRFLVGKTSEIASAAVDNRPPRHPFDISPHRIVDSVVPHMTCLHALRCTIDRSWGSTKKDNVGGGGQGEEAMTIGLRRDVGADGACNTFIYGGAKEALKALVRDLRAFTPSKGRMGAVDNMASTDINTNNVSEVSLLQAALDLAALYQKVVAALLSGAAPADSAAEAAIDALAKQHVAALLRRFIRDRLLPPLPQQTSKSADGASPDGCEKQKRAGYITIAKGDTATNDDNEGKAAGNAKGEKEDKFGFTHSDVLFMSLLVRIASDIYARDEALIANHYNCVSSSSCSAKNSSGRQRPRHPPRRRWWFSRVCAPLLATGLQSLIVAVSLAGAAPLINEAFFSAARCIPQTKPNPSSSSSPQAQAATATAATKTLAAAAGPILGRATSTDAVKLALIYVRREYVFVLQTAAVAVAAFIGRREAAAGGASALAILRTCSEVGRVLRHAGGAGAASAAVAQGGWAMADSVAWRRGGLPIASLVCGLWVRDDCSWSRSGDSGEGEGEAVRCGGGEASGRVLLGNATAVAAMIPQHPQWLSNKEACRVWLRRELLTEAEAVAVAREQLHNCADTMGSSTGNSSGYHLPLLASAAARGQRGLLYCMVRKYLSPILLSGGTDEDVAARLFHHHQCNAANAAVAGSSLSLLSLGSNALEGRSTAVYGRNELLREGINTALRRSGGDVASAALLSPFRGRNSSAMAIAAARASFGVRSPGFGVGLGNGGAPPRRSFAGSMLLSSPSPSRRIAGGGRASSAVGEGRGTMALFGIGSGGRANGSAALFGAAAADDDGPDDDLHALPLLARDPLANPLVATFAMVTVADGRRGLLIGVGRLNGNGREETGQEGEQYPREASFLLLPVPQPKSSHCFEGIQNAFSSNKKSVGAPSPYAALSLMSEAYSANVLLAAASAIEAVVTEMAALAPPTTNAEATSMTPPPPAAQTPQRIGGAYGDTPSGITASGAATNGRARAVTPAHGTPPPRQQNFYTPPPPPNTANRQQQQQTPAIANAASALEGSKMPMWTSYDRRIGDAMAMLYRRDLGGIIRRVCDVGGGTGANAVGGFGADADSRPNIYPISVASRDGLFAYLGELALVAPYADTQLRAVLIAAAEDAADALLLAIAEEAEDCAPAAVVAGGGVGSSSAGDANGNTNGEENDDAEYDDEVGGGLSLDALLMADASAAEAVAAAEKAADESIRRGETVRADLVDFFARLFSAVPYLSPTARRLMYGSSSSSSSSRSMQMMSGSSTSAAPAEHSGGGKGFPVALLESVVAASFSEGEAVDGSEEAAARDTYPCRYCKQYEETMQKKKRTRVEEEEAAILNSVVRTPPPPTPAPSSQRVSPVPARPFGAYYAFRVPTAPSTAPNNNNTYVNTVVAAAAAAGDDRLSSVSQSQFVPRGKTSAPPLYSLDNNTSRNHDQGAATVLKRTPPPRKAAEKRRREEDGALERLSPLQFNSSKGEFVMMPEPLQQQRQARGEQTADAVGAAGECTCGSRKPPNDNNGAEPPLLLSDGADALAAVARSIYGEMRAAVVDALSVAHCYGRASLLDFAANGSGDGVNKSRSDDEDEGSSSGPPLEAAEIDGLLQKVLLDGLLTACRKAFPPQTSQTSNKAAGAASHAPQSTGPLLLAPPPMDLLALPREHLFLSFEHAPALEALPWEATDVCWGQPMSRVPSAAWLRSELRLRQNNMEGNKDGEGKNATKGCGPSRRADDDADTLLAALSPGGGTTNSFAPCIPPTNSVSSPPQLPVLSIAPLSADRFNFLLDPDGDLPTMRRHFSYFFGAHRMRGVIGPLTDTTKAKQIAAANNGSSGDSSTTAAAAAAAGNAPATPSPWTRESFSKAWLGSMMPSLGRREPAVVSSTITASQQQQQCFLSARAVGFFTFLGHGHGRSFMPPAKVAEVIGVGHSVGQFIAAPEAPVMALMGCESARLSAVPLSVDVRIAAPPHSSAQSPAASAAAIVARAVPTSAPSSVVQTYLAVGSPAVVGCLWTVIDGEINKLTAQTLGAVFAVSPAMSDRDTRSERDAADRAAGIAATTANKRRGGGGASPLMPPPQPQPRSSAESSYYAAPSLAVALAFARRRARWRFGTGGATVMYGLPMLTDAGLAAAENERQLAAEEKQQKAFDGQPRQQQQQKSDVTDAAEPTSQEGGGGGLPSCNGAASPSKTLFDIHCLLDNDDDDDMPIFAAASLPPPPAPAAPHHAAGEEGAKNENGDKERDDKRSVAEPYDGDAPPTAPLRNTIGPSDAAEKQQQTLHKAHANVKEPQREAVQKEEAGTTRTAAVTMASRASDAINVDDEEDESEFSNMNTSKMAPTATAAAVIVEVAEEVRPIRCSTFDFPRPPPIRPASSVMTTPATATTATDSTNSGVGGSGTSLVRRTTTAVTTSAAAVIIGTKRSRTPTPPPPPAMGPSASTKVTEVTGGLLSLNRRRPTAASAAAAVIPPPPPTTTSRMGNSTQRLNNNTVRKKRPAANAAATSDDDEDDAFSLGALLVQRPATPPPPLSLQQSRPQSQQGRGRGGAASVARPPPLAAAMMRLASGSSGALTGISSTPSRNLVFSQNEEGDDAQ